MAGFYIPNEPDMPPKWSGIFPKAETPPPPKAPAPFAKIEALLRIEQYNRQDPDHIIQIERDPQEEKQVCNLDQEQEHLKRLQQQHSVLRHAVHAKRWLDAVLQLRDPDTQSFDWVRAEAAFSQLARSAASRRDRGPRAPAKRVESINRKAASDTHAKDAREQRKTSDEQRQGLFAYFRKARNDKEEEVVAQETRRKGEHAARVEAFEAAAAQRKAERGALAKEAEAEKIRRKAKAATQRKEAEANAAKRQAEHAVRVTEAKEAQRKAETSARLKRDPHARKRSSSRAREANAKEAKRIAEASANLKRDPHQRKRSVSRASGYRLPSTGTANRGGAEMEDLVSRSQMNTVQMRARDLHSEVKKF